jgi:hypothetical protein
MAKRTQENPGGVVRYVLVSVLIAAAALASSPGHAGKTSPFASVQRDELFVLVQRGAPADLNKYSLRFWPRNSLHRGQVVSTSTPHGRLTCRSTGRDRPRDCSLSRR